MKVQIDTEKKEITFLSSFTIEELMNLGKILNTDLQDWRINPYASTVTVYREYPYRTTPWYSLNPVYGTTSLLSQAVDDVTDSVYKGMLDRMEKKDAPSTLKELIADIPKYATQDGNKLTRKK